MKRSNEGVFRLRCFIGQVIQLVLLVLIISIVSFGTSFAQTWDITNDWSDTANPNGVWSYRHGSTALSWVPDIGAPLTSFNQGAWGGSGSVGSFLPLWGKLQAYHGDYDLQAGDIFMHSTDSANGGGHGVGNTNWTSPIDGSISIDGSAWMTREIGRSNHWSLLVNGSTITGGDVYSGDQYSRANPFYFGSGSGGSSVLENLQVSLGDVVELRISNISGAGDFVGVDFSITDQTFQFDVNPKGTVYDHRPSDVPTVIDLEAIGVQPGMVVYLERVGAYSFFSNSCSNPIGYFLYAVFSTDSAVVPAGTTDIRVPGTIDLGLPDTTEPIGDFCVSKGEGVEEFNGIEIQVPEDAAYLAVGSGDSYYLDNQVHCTEGVYAIKITVLETNEPPVAEAGTNQSIHVGELVQLDGSGSNDTETLTEDLIYSWSFDSVPAGSSAAFDLANPIKPTFITDLPGDYVVSLVVTDAGGLSSAPDQLTLSSLNTPPTADAGVDQGTYVGNTVVLDGSGSSDPNSDPIASYNWTFVSQPVGSSAVLTNAGTASPFFVPDLDGTYTVQLIVNDGYTDSAQDTVTIVVISTKEYAEVQSMEVFNIVVALPPGSVTNSGNQTALGNKLLQVIESLQDDPPDFNRARKKLTDAIKRTDGCALRGTPDLKGGANSPKADTINNCTDQEVIYPLLADALDAISP